ncbi:MAG: glycolate oxidase iron-sulfur subunit [Desulfonauticus sp.]|nr:glycolate oxidase iron-sulfur subunit [Desulfonauticus sp.]
MKKSKLILLAKEIKKIEEELVKCMQCGLCQAVCPLFKETRLESDVARGKIFLLKQLGENLLTQPELVQKYLDRCLLCGSCGFNCPSGVLGDKIFLRARTILKEFLGLSFIEKRVLATLLRAPKNLDFACLLLKKSTPLWSSQEQDFLIPKMGLKRPILPLAKEFWQHKVGKIDETRGQLKVALYPGCLVDKVFPEVGFNMLKVLRYLGVGIFYPGVSLCCGLPLLTCGNVDGFKKVVLENLKYYQQVSFDYLLTPCASCTYTLSSLWKIYAPDLSLEDREVLTEISSKTLDIGVFLHQHLDKKDFKKDREENLYTYHDPCHLRKSLKVYVEPRSILKSLTNFVEMEASEECCGFAGSFNLKYYELSQKIGLKKVQNILNTKAKAVATSCPACMYQLKLLLKDKPVEVVHLVDVVAQNIG